MRYSEDDAIDFLKEAFRKTDHEAFFTRNNSMTVAGAILDTETVTEVNGDTTITRRVPVVSDNQLPLYAMRNSLDFAIAQVYDPSYLDGILAELQARGTSSRTRDDVKRILKNRYNELIDDTKREMEEEWEERRLEAGGQPNDIVKREPPPGMTWAGHLFNLTITDGMMEQWHNEYGEPWVTQIDGRSLRVADSAFESLIVSKWNEQNYYLPDQNGWSDDPVFIGTSDIQKCLATIRSNCIRGPEYRTHIRTAPLNDPIIPGGGFVLDLGCGVGLVDENRIIDPDCIVVTQDGWDLSYVKKHPVKFRKGTGAACLPKPEPTKDLEDTKARLEEFREWLRMTPDEFRVYISYLTYSMQPQRSYPILVFVGPKGSMKTTRSTAARKMIDPSIAEQDEPPDDPRNFAIACDHQHIVCLDNVSHLSKEVQDMMARTATGAGFRHRELYTSKDLTVFAYVKPQICGGIGESVTASDVLERSYVLRTTRPSGNYRSDVEAWADFDKNHGRWLGAVLDVVVYGLNNINETSVPGDLRMAAFAQWGSAIAPILGWTEDKWLTNYRTNQNEGVIITLESSLIGPLLVKMARNLNKVGNWDENGNYREVNNDDWKTSYASGTFVYEATSETFLSHLKAFARSSAGDNFSEQGALLSKLPQTPTKLREALMRYVDALETLGIVIDLEAKFGPRDNRQRCIRMSYTPNATAEKFNTEDHPEPEPLAFEGALTNGHKPTPSEIEAAVLDRGGR